MSKEEALYVLNHIVADHHVIYDNTQKDICFSAKLVEALYVAKECLKGGDQ